MLMSKKEAPTMLEEKIDALTAAIKENTAELKKAQASGAVPGKTASSDDGDAPAKPPKGKKGPKPEDVKAAVVKVKDEIDQDAAKAIIKKAGAKDLAALLAMPDKFASVLAACEAALAAAGVDEDDESEDDDDL